MLPAEALVTESGELSEQGRTYIPPRVLQEMLCVVSCVAGLDADPEEKENLALEMLLVSNHPSLGECFGGLILGVGLACVLRGAASSKSLLPFLSSSGRAVWSLASPPDQDEARPRRFHHQTSRKHF